MLDDYHTQMYIDKMTKKMLVVVWAEQGLPWRMFSQCKQCGEGEVLGKTKCCKRSLCSSCAKKASACVSFDIKDKRSDPWRYNADIAFTCPFCGQIKQEGYSE